MRNAVFKILLLLLSRTCTISDSEVKAQSHSDAALVSNEDVWDSVKFSFEIEEVSAAVFWKETAKVTYAIAQSSCNFEEISHVIEERVIS